MTECLQRAIDEQYGRWFSMLCLNFTFRYPQRSFSSVPSALVRHSPSPGAWRPVGKFMYVEIDNAELQRRMLKEQEKSPAHSHGQSSTKDR